MQVRRFISDSMQGALKQVRDELGADAVILSNERIDGQIELVAAIGYEEDIAEDLVSALNPPKPKRQQAPQVKKPSPVTKPSQAAKRAGERKLELQEALSSSSKRIQAAKQQQQARRQPRSASEEQLRSDPRLNANAPASFASSAEFDQEICVEEAPIHPQAQAQDSDELASIRDELKALKSMINDSKTVSLNAHAAAKPKSAHFTRIENELQAMCVSAGLVKSVTDTLKDDMDYQQCWQQTKRVLSKSFEIEQGDLIDEGGVIALVGPTGSGKTMTIGKLAARFVMKYGNDSVALVTTDRYRIAAHEQLRVFGRILNVPVHAVDEQNNLDAILDRLATKRLVLVDTAGLRPSDEPWEQQLNELKQSGHAVQSYLAVPAVDQYQVMCANLHHYRVVDLAGVIATKLDEAVSLGELISFMAVSKLSMAYYTDGQGVPDSLHLVDALGLITKAKALLNTAERWVTISTQNSTDGDSASLFQSA